MPTGGFFRWAGQRASPCENPRMSSWVKASASGTGNCVEVAVGDVVRVRDSKDPDGPVLTFTHSEWEAFLERVRRGEIPTRVAG